MCLLLCHDKNLILNRLVNRSFGVILLNLNYYFYFTKCIKFTNIFKNSKFQKLLTIKINKKLIVIIVENNAS